jgi:hypothetical protein
MVPVGMAPEARRGQHALAAHSLILCEVLLTLCRIVRVWRSRRGAGARHALLSCACVASYAQRHATSLDVHRLQGSGGPSVHTLAGRPRVVGGAGCLRQRRSRRMACSESGCIVARRKAAIDVGEVSNSPQQSCRARKGRRSELSASRPRDLKPHRVCSSMSRLLPAWANERDVPRRLLGRSPLQALLMSEIVWLLVLGVCSVRGGSTWLHGSRLAVQHRRRAAKPSTSERASLHCHVLSLVHCNILVG